MTVEGVLKAVKRSVDAIGLSTAKGRYDRFEREIPKFAKDLCSWEKLGPEDVAAVEACIRAIRSRLLTEVDAERMATNRRA